MEKSGERVSILGCGWLGLPLAEFLVQAGYQVAGSTTTPDKLTTLRNQKIQPYLINLAGETDASDFKEFLKTDYLVVSFPPRLRAGQEKLYFPQIQRLYTALTSSPVKHVLFISSTSVYHDVNREITEDDVAALDQDSPLYQAEELIKQNTSYITTIVRFGGLVGGNRHPGRFLAGKTGVSQGEAPVNLIHLEDCVAILARLMAQIKSSQTFNAVADEHPTRRQFYTAAAKNLLLDPPQFAPAPSPVFKIISNAKVKEQLAYEFIYPDPMFFF